MTPQKSSLCVKLGFPPEDLSVKHLPVPTPVLVVFTLLIEGKSKIILYGSVRGKIKKQPKFLVIWLVA